MPKRERGYARTGGGKSLVTNWQDSGGEYGHKCLRILKDKWPTPKLQQRLYDDGWVCWGCFDNGDFKYVRVEAVKHLMN